MHVTEIAIHKTLGMELAAAGDSHILALPESPLLLNHVGTVHAGIQFVLAEACSGEFLIRHFGDNPHLFAVLRASKVKFRNPARGVLRASARLCETPGASPRETLAARGRTFASVQVEIADGNDVVTMTGQYDWFLQRQADPT
jgi:acyl-coenzyme A thioesterase PaaI-like protein